MATTATQVADAYKSILLTDAPGGANGAYAISVAAQINAGLLTIDNFEASLIGLPQTMYTTLPALVTIDAFYGATPSQSILSTAAVSTSSSVPSALQMHNAGYSDANVWTIMGSYWGADPNSQFNHLYGGLATGNSADYQTFINEVYQREFGTLPTQTNLGYLMADIPGVQQLLSGGGHTATAIQVMGGLFGYLLYAGQTNNTGAYTTPALNFLSIAAKDEANAPGSSASLYGPELLANPITDPQGTAPTQTYLTTAADNVTANNVYGDLTQYSFNGVGPTLNSTDVINGSPGSTDNTLTITDGYAQGQDILPAGVTLNNVQNVVLQTAGNAGAGALVNFGANTTPLDVAPFSSVTQLTVTSSGAGNDLVNGGTNTAITVQHNNSNGGVQVTGGSSVTVNTAGNNGVQVGQFGLPATDPTGAVAITDTAVGGNIGVLGGAATTGSAVSVSATNATYNGAISIGAAPGQQPNGAVSVTDNGMGGSIAVYGGTDVAVTVAPALTSTAGAQNATVVVGDITGNYQQPSGNVTVTQTAKVAYDNLAGAAHNNAASGNVQVYGGTNVTVASNAGGPITIGSAATGTANPVAPSGVVTVTDTSSDLNGAFGIGTYVNDTGTTINGGATASANVTAEGAGVTVNLAQSTTGTNTNGAVTVTEQADATNANVTGVSHQTITVNGGNGVTVNALGQTVNVGTGSGTGGAQVVNQSAVLTGAGLGQGMGGVTVDGGSSVNVTTTGGNVMVGGKTNAGFQVSSGPVTVTDSFGGVSNDAITVLGGAAGITGNAVSINTTATSGDITVGNGAPAATNLAQDPTGNVSIVDTTTSGSSTVYGTGAVNVTTNGATLVSVRGGAANTIQDAQNAMSGLGGTNSLASVSLDAAQTGGQININSDALASLAVLDNGVAGNSYVVNDATANHALALTVNNDSKAFTVTDNTAGTVTVGDNGTASTGTLSLDAAAATGVTFNNSAALTTNLAGAPNLNVLPDNALKTITATGAGSLNLGNLSGLGNLTSVNASTATGAVTAEINGVTSFAGGSGANTVTVDATPNWAGGVTIAGGSGSSNTLVANYTVGGADPALSTKVSGFQTLGLGSNASGTFDGSGFKALQVAGATNGPVGFSNVAAGTALTLENSANATGSGSTVNYFLAKLAASNALTINLGLDNTTGAASKIGTNATGSINQAVFTQGIQNVTLNSAGFVGKVPAGSANAGATVTNSVTLNDGALTSVTIIGDQATKVFNTLPTLTQQAGGVSSAVTTIDASNSTGSTVDVSGVAGALSGIAITGGSGVLIAHGTMNGTTVAGADVGLQQDSVTLGGGWGAGDTVSETINGNTYTYTVTAADVGPGLNALQAAHNVAVGLANVVNQNVAASTLTAAVANNSSTLTFTAGTPGVGFADAAKVAGINGTVGVQTTTANQAAQPQVDQFVIGGAWAPGNVASITINGHLYTYTVTAFDLLINPYQAIANGLANAINANAAANGDLVIASTGTDQVMLTSPVPGIGFTDVSAVASPTGTIAKSAIQPNVPAAAQVDTVTISGGFGVGDTVSETINGNTYTYTVTAADEGATTLATDANIAAKLATVIGHANGALASAVAHPDGTILLTAAVPGVALASDTAGSTSSAMVTGQSTTTVAPSQNFTSANDTFTVGTGGGVLTLGTGGGWNPYLANSQTAQNPAFTGATDTGSETVNLGNEAKASTLVVNDGVIAYFNGSKGGVNNFHIPAAAGGIADQITFANAGGNDAKSILANLATQTSVTTAIGAAGVAAAGVLDPTGKLASALTDLSFTVSNGLIQFVGTGGQAVSNFTPSQLQQAAQLILDYAAIGGANKVAAINTLGANGVGSTGDILIVASSANPVIAAGVNGGDTNSIIDLRGIATSATSFQGFGTTAAANTVVVTDLVAAGPNVNTGSATTNTTYTTANSGGLQQHDAFTVGAVGVTNTYNDLAGSAQLNIGGAAAGNLVVNQNGVSGQESLTLNFTGAVTLANATVSGDSLLAITGGNTDEIKSLTDATGTLSTITIGAGEAITLDAITAAALTSIKAGSDNANLTLGGATSALSQAGLNVTVGNGNDAIYASGAGDTITAGDGFNTITASGAGDTISGGNGFNKIVANGNGDTISVGQGGYAITANGAGDTISVGIDPHGVMANASAGIGNTIQASGANDSITFNGPESGSVTVDGGQPTVGVGANATVTFAKSFVDLGSETVVLTGDTAGATTAGTVSMVTLINGLHYGAGGESLVFNNATNEVLAGGGNTLAGSQVNMSSIVAQTGLSSSAQLNAALNLAASQAAMSQVGGPNNLAGMIGANTGVFDWFQLNGNTYLVEATNNTAAPSTHTALAAGDTVVKLAGLVDLSQSTLTQTNLGMTLHI